MAEDRNPCLPLRLSLFPNVPPYVRILPPGETYSPPIPEGLQQLAFVAPGGISPIVVDCIKEAGFQLIEGNARQQDHKFTGAIWDCLPVTEKEKDAIAFGGLSPEVKINQFPGLFTVGRKDSLGGNYARMAKAHGGELFDFMPRTYVVPDDREELEQHMKETKKPLIVKPPNWFCGIGIKLINKVEDIPCKKNKMVVQEYIDNPFLIKGAKFDLRLYVLLTGIDPVKIYVYEEGLVRFCTAPYTNDPDQITNNFVHLTNYSVNKTSDEFVYNECPGSYDGHKWNLGTLWKYLEECRGIDWRPVWEKTKEVMVKTVLCGQEHMAREFAKQMKSDYSCYKLWGFDVMYDKDLKPWLIEVNNIPSLHVNTIDAFVNKPMVAEMFNIVGFHVPSLLAKRHNRPVMEALGLSKEEVPELGHDWRIYSRQRTAEDLKKREQLGTEENLSALLDDLTPGDVRTLVQAEEELSQCRGWERSFPTPSSAGLLPLLAGDVYSDRLLAAWEARHGGDRQAGRNILANLCREGRHTELPAPP